MNTEGYVTDLDDATAARIEKLRAEGKETEWQPIDINDMTEEQRKKYEAGENPVIEPDTSKLGLMLKHMQKIQRMKEERELKEARKKVKNRAKNKAARKARKKNRR
jgi:hypothetical protein